MAVISSLGSTAYVGKKGVIKPDEHGYRRVCLGAFNSKSVGGMNYPHVEAVWNNQKSTFRRLLHRKLLKGEWSHPEFHSKMSNAEMLARQAIIQSERVGVHIRSVELVSTTDDKGNPILAVYGYVKGSGLNPDALDIQMANPEENVAFSIRSFTKTDWLKKIKYVTDIVTWDIEFDPGMPVATKMDSLGCESLGYLMNDHQFTMADIASAEKIAAELSMINGNESTDVDFTMLRTDYGWDKVEKIEIAVPAWLGG